MQSEINLINRAGAVSLRKDGASENPRLLILDQRWPELCANLKELQMKYLGNSRELFRSRMIETEFGDLKVRRVVSQGGAHRAIRDKSSTDASLQGFLWICMVLKGRLQLRRDRRSSVLEEGDLSILDYAQTYSLEMSPPLIDSLWIGVPRALADSYFHNVDELFGIRLDRNLATTQAAWRVANAVFLEPMSLSGAHANRIASGVIGVVATAFDGNRAQQCNSPYRSRVLRRIKRYIEEHLEDDSLTVSQIARHQGVSKRYLAKIFEAEHRSVARWVWDRRLERCRRAMQEVAPGTTIAEIAFDNGFKNVSHFCRVFKARYGSSPGSIMRTN